MEEKALPATESPAAFARRLGFKRSYITQLKREGRVVMTEDGKKILVAESIARVADTKDPSKVGVTARHAASRAVAASDAADSVEDPDTQPYTQPPAQQNASGDSYQAARAVKERYLALEAKRAYEVAIGKQLDAAHVEAAATNAATLFRTSLESLPTVIGVQVAAETDELRCTAVIAEAIEQALAELSRKFASLSNPKGTQ